MIYENGKSELSNVCVKLKQNPEKVKTHRGSAIFHMPLNSPCS